MAYLEVCRLKQYYILLDKLKIHCVKEHILSFITGINGTITPTEKKNIKPIYTRHGVESFFA
jgi:hypothetical protein